MQQALEQLRAMRDTVRPPGISPGEARGPAAQMMTRPSWTFLYSFGSWYMQ
jgi:hypothetical protein